MHLTPREQERLLLAAGAELARRRLARGSRLGVSEALALVCDEVLEAAWDGLSLDEAIERGRQAVPRESLISGAASLAPTVQVEALFPHGSVLVHIDAPLGPADPHGPGAVRPATVRSPSGRRDLAAGRERIRVRATNTGHAAVWISSHFPLDAVNPVVTFEGLPAGRWRLDLPAGVCRELVPGESSVLSAVRLGGSDSDGPGDDRGGGDEPGRERDESTGGGR